MPEILDFRGYCAHQIERLTGAHPEMRFYRSGALEELANWLEAKAAGDHDKASALVTEATEYAEIPGIAALNAIWNRLFPPAIPIAAAGCSFCAGSGYEIIERAGLSGAARCRCGGVAVADPNLSYVSNGATL